MPLNSDLSLNPNFTNGKGKVMFCLSFNTNSTKEIGKVIITVLILCHHIHKWENHLYIKRLLIYLVNHSFSEYGVSTLSQVLFQGYSEKGRVVRRAS